MTKFSSRIVVAAVLIATCCLNACSNRLNEQAGIEGTGDKVASRGVVTKLGSIYVNGIHFDTDMAEIYVDGDLTSDETQLQGMVVIVEGTMGESDSEAYALKVQAQYLVKGPVSDIKVDENNLLYLTLPGYTVMVPENTVFSGTDYDSLAIGDLVGVSGLEVDPGTLYASQIIAEEPDLETTVTGTISNAELLQKRFEINGLTVDYTMAVLTGNEDDIIANGKQVRVIGQISEDQSTLDASKISPVTPFEYSDNLYVIEEGFVYNYNGSEDFWVNGVEIDASKATLNGGSLNDLGNQARVSVSGTVSDNVLVADNIQIILPSTLRTTGHVSFVNLMWRQFMMEDITFYTDPFTVFSDATDAFKHFDLFDMREGDQLEVYARRTDFGWKAVTVRRIAGEPAPLTIKGKITALAPNGDFYLEDLLVSIADIPFEARWPYMPGQSVFVMGTMSNEGTLQAETIFPAVSGCTGWEIEGCRPEPDLTYGWWTLPPPP